jgi:hypothetical protein
MRKKDCARASTAAPHLLEGACEGALSECPDGQTRQRHSDLHARYDAVQIAEQTLDDPRPNIALNYKLSNPGKPHGNKGIFRGREKAVERDERQDADQAHCKHGFSGFL